LESVILSFPLAFVIGVLPLGLSIDVPGITWAVFAVSGTTLATSFPGESRVNFFHPLTGLKSPGSGYNPDPWQRMESCSEAFGVTAPASPEWMPQARRHDNLKVFDYESN
jgi:hypothetical protein